MPDHPTKITFAEMRDMGVRGLQSCNCSTSVTIEGFLNIGGTETLVATQSVGIPGSFVGGNGNAGVPPSIDIFTLTGFGDVDKVVLLSGSQPVNVNDITIGPIATVPELSTWTMMVVGFAGLGFLAYRKKSNLRFA